MLTSSPILTLTYLLHAREGKLAELTADPLVPTAAVMAAISTMECTRCSPHMSMTTTSTIPGERYCSDVKWYGNDGEHVDGDNVGGVTPELDLNLELQPAHHTEALQVLAIIELILGLNLWMVRCAIAMYLSSPNDVTCRSGTDIVAPGRPIYRPTV